MKRGTPRNPKVLHLANLLKVKVPTAVGYLELLWHFTAEFAPQGDIGRFDDKWIEAALFWTGRPGFLIHCLTVTRWLDSHSSHRVIVHDWHDHADDSVRKRLNRASLQFLTLADKVTGQSTVTDRTLSSRVADNGCLPEPLPEPCQSHAYTNGRVRVTDLNGQTSQRFDEFWDRYPRQQHRDAACQQWLSVVTVAVEPAVFDCLHRYLQSDEVSRGAVANPEKWLHEQHRDAWAGNWPPARLAAPQRRESVTEQAIRMAKERQSGTH